MRDTVNRDAPASPTKERCGECGIYQGVHRPSCSRLDRLNKAAVKDSYEVESYLYVQAR